MNKRISDLITIFLAIAILVSTGAWFWSNRGDERRIAPRGVVSEEPTSINNAFVRGEQSATEMAVAKDNMTYRLAESLAAKMQEYNPDGPGDASNPGIWQPNAEMVLEEFLTKKEIYGPVVLDQAAALAKRTKLEEVNVLENASPEETANYLQAFAQIAQENFLDKRVQGLIEGEAGADGVSVVAVTMGQSLKKLDELKVPKEYLGIHVATRNVILDLGQILELPIASADDPMRMTLAVEGQIRKLNSSLEKMRSEFSDPKLISLLEKNAKNGSLTTGLSVINVANASGLPVIDLANLGARLYEIGKQMGEWVRKWVTETLKDVLVHKLIQQTIGWIQGNGKPKFITNWKSFLGDVANQAGGDFLYRINPKLCTSFGPMIRVALTPVTTAPDKGITCTLDQVMSNVQDFYDNFSNGGWIAYGATLQPSNNFFGAYMQASDMLMVEKAQKTQAKESEAKSSSGFLGTKMCTKWEYRAPQADPTDPAYISCINQCKLSPVVDCEKECAPQGPPQKVCVEEKTTTPGDMVAKALGDLPGAPLQRIVNAQDITALVNALVNAAMSKLVSAAKNIGPDSNGDPGVLGLDASVLPPSLFGPFCVGLKGDLYKSCVEETKKTCNTLPPELKDQCLAAIAPESDKCSDASCDAPDIPIKYKGEVSSAVDAAKGSADLSTPEGRAAYRQAVTTDLVGQGFVGNAEAINCNGNPSGDSIIIGRVGDDYAEYFDIIVGSKGPSPSAGIGYTEPADWKRCRGCGQTSPNTCDIFGGGGDPPGASSTLPQITSLNPNPGWPKAMHLITGEKMKDPIKVWITDGAGNTTNPPMTGDGKPVKDGTQLYFYGPDLPDGNYSLQVGSTLASSSNIIVYEIRRNLKDSSIVEATIGWDGDAVNNPTANNWLVVSGASSGIYGSIVGDDATTTVPMFRLSQDTSGVGIPRTAFSSSASKYLVVFVKETSKNTNLIYGQFIDSTGARLGSNFTIGGDVPGATRNMHLQYDSIRNKFVLVIWKYGGTILLKTIDVDGTVGSAILVSNGANGAARLAINENSGEYCVAYGDSNEKEIRVRPVNATTLQPGAEAVILPNTYGAITGTEIVYNSRDNKYLVAWGSFKDGAFTARFLQGCDANNLGNVFTLKLGRGGSLAYNSGSNTYAVGSESDIGLRNLFVAFDSEGKEIDGTRKEVFLDGINGNYVPIVRPNNRTGAYGMASARDYAVYRFAPNLGGDILRVK